MSTHAKVGIDEGGSIKAIYIHSDGYVAGVGDTLKCFYNTEDKVEELIEMGDCSHLGESLDEDESCFYHRDRGESLKISNISEADLAKCEEYNYLFKGGVWYISCDDSDYKWVKLCT